MTESFVVHFGPQNQGSSIDDLAQLCAELTQVRVLSTFDDRAVEFCSRLSKILLTHPEGRAYPQVISLGYWLRPAAIKKLINSYGDQPDILRVPRGLAFHLPPANVDTLFVYSWILSVLAGNTNLVRLPTNLNVVATLLLRCIAQASDEVISATNAFISYDRNDELTCVISRHCACRVVWGGDEKVTHIRSIPLPPNSIDLNFANRFSMSAVKLDSYLGLDDGASLALADKFYNDVYWFDQMGCASPRIVYWVGSESKSDFEKAQERFYRDLEAVTQRRGYEVDVGVSVAKSTFAYRSILDSDVTNYRRYGPAVTSLNLSKPVDVREFVQGGGVLFNAKIGDLTDLAHGVGRQDQTLSYFGFDKSMLAEFVRTANGRGIDRLVPIGQALDFGHIWDGWDLIVSLTRLVRTL